MKKTIKFTILEKDDFSKLSKQILNFYKPKYKVPFTKTTVDNSAIICLAMVENKIVGAIRAISDLSRHAEIVDLFVDEYYRKQKIGTKLVQLILDRLIKYKVKNICLVTEPHQDWLIAFYDKFGFKLSKESIHLELEK